jgi:hypothetical protein
MRRAMVEGKVKEKDTMRSFLKIALIAAMLLMGGSAAHAQVSIGVSIGAPPPPRVVYVEPPPPGQEFIWVEGYWYPAGKHYRWHGGYWTRPPYEGAYWVAPRYDGRQFFIGYWAGDHGRIEHDHHWDRRRDRDHDHDEDRGERNGHHDHERNHDHEDQDRD